jgi:hypothetical protein
MPDNDLIKQYKDSIRGKDLKKTPSVAVMQQNIALNQEQEQVIQEKLKQENEMVLERATQELENFYQDFLAYESTIQSKNPFFYRSIRGSRDRTPDYSLDKDITNFLAECASTPLIGLVFLGGIDLDLLPDIGSAKQRLIVRRCKDHYTGPNHLVVSYTKNEEYEKSQIEESQIREQDRWKEIFRPVFNRKNTDKIEKARTVFKENVPYFYDEKDIDVVIIQTLNLPKITNLSESFFNESDESVSMIHTCEIHYNKEMLEPENNNFPEFLKKICDSIDDSEIKNILDTLYKNEYLNVFMLLNLRFMQIYYINNKPEFYKKIRLIEEISKQFSKEDFLKLFDPHHNRVTSVIRSWPAFSIEKPESMQYHCYFDLKKSDNAGIDTQSWRPDYLLHALDHGYDTEYDLSNNFKLNPKFNKIFSDLVTADRSHLPFEVGLTKDALKPAEDLYHPLKKLNIFSEFLNNFKRIIDTYQAIHGINLEQYKSDDFIIALLNQVNTSNQRFEMNSALYRILNILEINAEQKTLEQQLIIFESQINTNEDNKWIDVSDSDYIAFSRAFIKSKFLNTEPPISLFSPETSMNDQKLKIHDSMYAYFRMDTSDLWLKVLDKPEKTTQARLKSKINNTTDPQEKWTYIYLWYQYSLSNLSSADDYKKRSAKFKELSKKIFSEGNSANLNALINDTVSFLEDTHPEEVREEKLYKVLTDNFKADSTKVERLWNIFKTLPTDPADWKEQIKLDSQIVNNLAKLDEEKFNKWFTLNLGETLPNMRDTLLAKVDFSNQNQEHILVAGLISCPGNIPDEKILGEILNTAIPNKILDFLPSCSSQALTLDNIESAMQQFSDGKFVFANHYKNPRAAHYLGSIRNLEPNHIKSLTPLTTAVLNSNGTDFIEASSSLCKIIMDTFPSSNTRSAIFSLVADLIHAGIMNKELFNAMGMQINNSHSLNVELIRAVIDINKSRDGPCIPSAENVAYILFQKTSFHEQHLIFQKLTKLPKNEKTTEIVKQCLYIKDSRTVISLINTFSKKDHISDADIKLTDFLQKEINGNNHRLNDLVIELLDLTFDQENIDQNFEGIRSLDPEKRKQIVFHIRLSHPKPTLTEALEYIKGVNEERLKIPYPLSRFSLPISEMVKHDNHILTDRAQAEHEQSKINKRNRISLVDKQAVYNKDLYDRFEIMNTVPEGQLDPEQSKQLTLKYRMAQRYLSRISFETENCVSKKTDAELYNFCEKLKKIYGEKNKRPPIKERIEFISVLREIYCRTNPLEIFPHDGQILSLFLASEGYPKAFLKADTGEGKSIIAAMSAAWEWGCGGLHAGIGTYNTKLAQDGFKSSAGFFNFLGMSVACLDGREDTRNQIVKGKRPDVIYGEFSELDLFSQQNPTHYSPSESIYIIDEYDYAAWYDERTNIITRSAEPDFSRCPLLLDWILEFTDDNQNITKEILQELPGFLEKKIDQFFHSDRIEKIKYKHHLNKIWKSDIEVNKLEQKWITGTLAMALKSAFHAKNIYENNKKAQAQSENNVSDEHQDKLKPEYMVGEIIQSEKVVRLAQIIESNSRPNPNLRWPDLTHHFVHLLIEQAEKDIKTDTPPLPFDKVPASLPISMNNQANFIAQHNKKLGLSATSGGPKAKTHFRSQGYHLFDIPRKNVNRSQNKLREIVSGKKDYIEANRKAITQDAKDTGNRPVFIFQKNKDTAIAFFKDIRQDLESPDILYKTRPNILQYFDGKTGEQWVWNDENKSYQKNPALMTEVEFNATASQQGTLSISTPSQSRGVDITPKHPEGILVIVGFLADSISEEIQMLGRTARHGAEGAFQYIFNYFELPKAVRENLNQDRSNFDSIAEEWRNLGLANKKEVLVDGIVKFSVIASITETYSRQNPGKNLSQDLQWSHFLQRLFDHLNSEKFYEIPDNNSITFNPKLITKLKELASQSGLKTDGFIDEHFFKEINDSISAPLAELILISELHGNDLVDPELFKFISKYAPNIDQHTFYHTTRDLVQEVGFYLAQKSTKRKKENPELKKENPVKNRHIDEIFDIYNLHKRNFLQFSLLKEHKNLSALFTPLFTYIMNLCKSSSPKKESDERQYKIRIKSGTLLNTSVEKLCTKLTSYTTGGLFKSQDRIERLNDLIKNLKDDGVKDISQLGKLLLEAHKGLLDDDQKVYEKNQWFSVRNKKGSRMSNLLAESLNVLHETIYDADDDIIRTEIDKMIIEYLNQSIKHIAVLSINKVSIKPLNSKDSIAPQLERLAKAIEEVTTTNKNTLNGLPQALRVFSDEIRIIKEGSSTAKAEEKLKPG